MRRLIAVALPLVVATLMLCCALPQSAEPTTTPTSTRQRATLATILLLHHEKPGLVCGGVRVASRVIVTAHHCLPNAIGLTPLEMLEWDIFDRSPNLAGRVVSFATYRDWIEDDKRPRRRPAVVATYDVANDLAVLVTAEVSREHVAVSPFAPGVDDRVFSVNHKLGQAYTFSRGRIEHPMRTWDRVDATGFFVQVDIAIASGSSGGGLFDENGNLAGICSFVICNRTGCASFFAHNEPIRRLLQKVSLA